MPEQNSMTPPVRVLYRFFDPRPWNWDVDKPLPRIESFTVLRETRCGYWIHLEGAKEKFVQKGADGKRWAYSTSDAALVSYRRRKERQKEKGQDAISTATTMLNTINSPGFDPEDCFPQIIH
jgi:hypothetical protein